MKQNKQPSFPIKRLKALKKLKKENKHFWINQNQNTGILVFKKSPNLNAICQKHSTFFIK